MMKSEKVRKLAHKLARQRAMRFFRGQVGLVKVYNLNKGWEREILRSDPGIHIIDHPLRVKDALLDVRAETILIDSDAKIPSDMFEQYCGKANNEKTVFIEV